MSIIEKAVGRHADEGRERKPDGPAAEHRGSATTAAKIPKWKELVPATSPPAGDQSTGGGRSRSCQIDLARVAAAGFLTASSRHGRLAEEFRHIKRPLLANAFGETAVDEPNANLILVTSALEGEGKTYCAVNLAMSLAMERDRRVLLIDADVTHSGTSCALGLEDEMGLYDILTNADGELADAMLRTNVPRLTVVPAGQRTSDSTELLGSERMREIAQQLAARYADRVVVFDAPPLLQASDTPVLASLVGQVVFVVEAEKTPQRAVLDALELLDRGMPIGLILNKSDRPPGPGSYYGYGYYGKAIPQAKET